MTTSSGLSGGFASPSPPAKGSFPLDHLSECREFARAYHKCLQNNRSQTNACRKLAREYLQCRMQRGLMAEDSWQTLGISRDSIVPDSNQHPDQDASSSPPTTTGSNQQKAFIAGAKLAEARKNKRGKAASSTGRPQKQDVGDEMNKK